MPILTPTTTTFLSKRRDLRLVRMPEKQLYNAQGEKAGMKEYPVFREDGEELEPIKGKTYEFSNGMLHVEPGEDLMRSGERGEVEDSLTWLKRHPRFKDQTDGFYELPQQTPNPTDELGQIAKLAAQRDAEGLRKLLEAEAQGWSREVVLDTAESALEALEAA